MVPEKFQGAMQSPLQITFRNMKRSYAVVRRIKTRYDRLNKFYNRIMNCRVTVSHSGKRHNQGNLFHISVDIRVPRAEIVVGRDPSKRHSHEDIYVAIRDTFNAVERRLEDRVRRSRVRVHMRKREKMPHGKVVTLMNDYGFLESESGREIYFSDRSVLNNHFKDLEVGSDVRFQEEAGEEGPQASTVQVIKAQKR